MAARRPTTAQQRAYAGSTEEAQGLPPADDQIWTHDEANDHTNTLEDHADQIDRIISDSSLQWIPGFSGKRTWVLNEDNAPVEYHSAEASSAINRAATVPGTDSAVWVRTEPETDFLATYNTAKT